MEGGDPMAEATQFDPDRLRVVLDHGEVVELDGGTLVLDGEESPSVVLRLAPWRARSVAQVLEEWSAASGVFNRASRSSTDELSLSRTLELAASVLDDDRHPRSLNVKLRRFRRVVAMRWLRRSRCGS